MNQVTETRRNINHESIIRLTREPDDDDDACRGKPYLKLGVGGRIGARE